MLVLAVLKKQEGGSAAIYETSNFNSVEISIRLVLLTLRSLLERKSYTGDVTHLILRKRSSRCTDPDQKTVVHQGISDPHNNSPRQVHAYTVLCCPYRVASMRVLGSTDTLAAR